MKTVARLAGITLVVALVQSVSLELSLVRAQEGKIVPYVPTPQEVVERMLARYRTELPLIDGAIAAVERLAVDFRLAVASSANRPLIEAVLESANLEHLFEVTVSSE